jgi:hypothetical protein
MDTKSFFMNGKEKENLSIIEITNKREKLITKKEINHCSTINFHTHGDN